MNYSCSLISIDDVQPAVKPLDLFNVLYCQTEMKQRLTMTVMLECWTHINASIWQELSTIPLTWRYSWGLARSTFCISPGEIKGCFQRAILLYYSVGVTSSLQFSNATPGDWFRTMRHDLQVDARSEMQLAACLGSSFRHSLRQEVVLVYLERYSYSLKSLNLHGKALSEIQKCVIVGCRAEPAKQPTLTIVSSIYTTQSCFMYMIGCKPRFHCSG